MTHTNWPGMSNEELLEKIQSVYDIMREQLDEGFCDFDEEHLEIMNEVMERIGELPDEEGRDLVEEEE